MDSRLCFPLGRDGGKLILWKFSLCLFSPLYFLYFLLSFFFFLVVYLRRYYYTRVLYTYICVYIKFATICRPRHYFGFLSEIELRCKYWFISITCFEKKKKSFSKSQTCWMLSMARRIGSNVSFVRSYINLCVVNSSLQVFILSSLPLSCYPPPPPLDTV